MLLLGYPPLPPIYSLVIWYGLALVSVGLERHSYSLLSVKIELRGNSAGCLVWQNQRYMHVCCLGEKDALGGIWGRRAHLLLSRLT